MWATWEFSGFPIPTRRNLRYLVRKCPVSIHRSENSTMLTAIACPQCRVRLQTPAKLLGKIIHCPKCKQPVRLGPRLNGSAPPPPPVDTPQMTEEELAAPPDSALETQAADDDFIAGLEQIDAGAPLENLAESAAETAPADEVEEPLEEVIEEGAAAEPGEEPAATEDVIEEEVAAEEAVEEEPPAKTAVTEKPAKKKKADAEKDEPPEALSPEVEKFLSANLFLMKGQSGIFSMNAAWDFLDPKTKQKIGSAVERPEGIMQALRFFLRRNWLPSKIEVREEATNELVFVIKRPSYFFNCTLEVRDAHNKLLAKFTYKPLSRMVGKPMPVERKGGEKFATCEFYFLKGRVDLMDENKTELANMQTESAYTKAIKIYWAPRGGSYYVTFNKPLFDKPYDKMVFLGVTLAMDLMQEDSKASAGKGGISIGT